MATGQNFGEEILLQFNKRFAPEKFRAMLEDAGKFALSSMQPDTPVRTGFLRDSEYYTVIADDTLELGASADYARWVNDGTSRQRAQPFFDRGREVCLKRINENLKKL